MARKRTPKPDQIPSFDGRDLTTQDVILISTSGGKDSLVTMHVVHALAVAQGVTHKLRAVHCDLGRMEWQGTRELVEKQCAMYGIPLYVVSRPQGDLLAHVAERGKWYSPKQRYCTSDHKRDQVTKVITRLVAEHIDTLGAQGAVRILSVMGLRAQESDARKAKRPIAHNKRASNGRRIVTDWLPIHQWTETQVWDLIHSENLPYHYAYDLGMPRLSCVFCIFAPKPALLLAGYHNRALLSEYVATEQATGHTFTGKIALVNIEATLNAGYVPTAKVSSASWAQCA